MEVTTDEDIIKPHFRLLNDGVGDRNGMVLIQHGFGMGR